MHRLSIRGQIRIGTVGEQLLRACERVALREAETRATIARWQADFAHRRDECAASVGLL